eukprot:252763-Pyramimonas_sp.AAC.1
MMRLPARRCRTVAAQPRQGSLLPSSVIRARCRSKEVVAGCDRAKLHSPLLAPSVEWSVRVAARAESFHPSRWLGVGSAS